MVRAWIFLIGTTEQNIFRKRADISVSPQLIYTMLHEI